LRNLRADRLAGSVVVVLAALVVWQSRGLPIGSFGRPGPGALPVGLAAIMGGLGALVAWRGHGSALGTLRWPEGPRAFGILAAVAFAAGAIESLGYRLTMAIVVVFLLRGLERKGWLASALAASGLSFGSYWLFATLLRTPLPVGPFGF
jgi:putative tricarboxylic transport membrane protein